ncbi:EF-hand domain-containing family member C2 [Lepeophtheirus salmonis]|uniref:EF-hand domain-containing family member C2 n=1 Tax=Lepeophtheirus salmonis TaxID=72036 RepID=UPI001AE7D7AC|nr:EF-hand domain-containing family member C2-like [Lepeophtheirus salmonis]XP_040580632.1 EF-hand domain-containing family member C2-like [Lepeophtheirus salmonis]
MSPPGHTRHLVLIFYREDETLEIRENHGVNCGRYKAPIFLKRGRPLKSNPEGYLPPPGFREDRILLNVVRSRGPGKLRDNYLKDNADDSYAKKRAYYTEDDFDVGKILKIEGREILIIDCDPATRDYYKKAHLREMNTIEVAFPYIKTPQKHLPPYNGFGSEEDSLTSCGGLEPKPPKRDFYKFMKKDRIGFNSHVLRFEGKLLDEDNNPDPNRRFIISYHLSDDTIGVSQTKQDNSSLECGKFLRRGRIKMPNQEIHYSSKDLYVGNIVSFYKHKFLLVSADDYVYDYMESEKESYPQSNLRIILNKLRNTLGSKGIKGMMSNFLEKDLERNEVLNEKTFRETLYEYTNGKCLNEHEMMTIIRFYEKAQESVRKSNGIFVEQWKLFSILQSELRKIHYTGFNDLLICLEDRDKEKKGLLDRKLIRSGILAAIITNSQSRTYNIRCVLDKCLNSFEDTELNYEAILNKMNWTKYPAKPVPPQFIRDNFSRNPGQNGVLIYRPIAYYEFIQELER